MKQFFTNRILRMSLALSALFVGAAPVLSATSVDNLDDIVEGVALLDSKPGETFTAPCSTTAANLEKRAQLVYTKEDGSLKVEEIDASAAK